MSTPARSRAAHLGPERRKPLLLDAALPLFAEHGFDGVSIERIAEAAGVTRPVVYDCFANKEQLFAALVEREERRLLEAMLASLPAQPRLDDTEALLTESFSAFLTAAASAPDSWRLVFGSSTRVATARAAMLDRLVEISHAVFTARDVSNPERSARVAAYMLVGMAEAGVRLLLERPGEWQPAELGRLLGRMTAPAEQALT